MEQRGKLKLLAISALFAAMICLVTAYLLHIPVGLSGGYIHIGDGLIFLAAAMLPKPYAIGAAVLGAGLADLLTAPVWIVATVVVKTLITLPFSARGEKLLTRRNGLAALVSIPISCGGYYLAEALMFGNWIAPALSIPVSLIQYGGSSALFFLAALVLDKAGIKKQLGKLYT